MLCNMLLFLILSSGSVFCAVYCGKSYEEILPITVLGSVLIIFLFGMAGFLSAGCVAVCAVAAVMYLAAVAGIIKKHNINAVLSSIFTPGFVFFACLMLFLVFANYGRMPSGTDSFSHWADIVKVMASLDDFGTNPNSHSAFQSYPPAMSLFQYFVQKLYQWTSVEFFSEWRVFFGHSIFFFSVSMPFFKGCSAKRPLSFALLAAIVLLSPLVLFSYAYEALQVDIFLAILFGCGFAAIILCDSKDWVYDTYIVLICAVLVIAKDVGLLLSIFLAVAFNFDKMCSYKRERVEKGNILQTFVSLLCSVAAVALPKFLWSRHLRVTSAEISFESKFGLNDLLHAFSTDDGYRKIVLINYYEKLFEPCIKIGNTDISVSHIFMAVVGILMGYLILRYLNKLFPDSKRKNTILFWILPVMWAFYTVGMCVIYMFNFSVYEATKVASFERYLGIVYFSCFYSLLLILCVLFRRHCERDNLREVFLLFAIILITPLKPFADFALRRGVSHSVLERTLYYTMINEITSKCEPGSKVYLIAQQTDGYEYWYLHYYSRPAILDGFYSIGEPKDEDDIWTYDITADYWKSLLDEGYDYVALYKLNDSFEKYSVLFENPDDIAENRVYKYDKDAGILSLCN